MRKSLLGMLSAIFSSLLLVAMLAEPASGGIVDVSTNINGVAISGGGMDSWYFGFNSNSLTMVITNGGRLYNWYDGAIGYNARGSNNLAIITGANSVWSNNTTFLVGNSGANNRLVVTNGGAMVLGWGCLVGNNAGADNNSVTVTGPGTTWSNGYDLNIGSAGSNNRLIIADGGKVTSAQFGYIGGFIIGNKNNSALITGSGSTWSLGDQFNVGYDGSGNSAIITNGGVVNCSGGFIGVRVSATNSSVTVVGDGSAWTMMTQRLYVGFNAGVIGCRLRVADGARVSSVGGTLDGTDSMATLTGSNSLWNVGNQTLILSSPQGVLNVLDGAALSNISTFTVSGARARCNLGDGGGVICTAAVNTVGLTGSNSLFVINNGLLLSRRSGSLTTGAGVMSNASTAYFSTEFVNTNLAVLTGAGNLVKEGSGKLLLATNNAYSGTTLINGGGAWVDGQWFVWGHAADRAGLGNLHGGCECRRGLHG